MSFSKTTTRIAGVLGAATLALSLAACSGGQSVAEACKIAEDTVTEAQGQMEGIMTDVMAGEGDMGDMFKTLDDALSSAEKKVSNTEVSDALKAVSDDFVKVGDVLGDFKMPSTDDLDYSDPEAMEKLTEMQGELEAISGKMEEASTSLTDSSKKLEELCVAK